MGFFSQVLGLDATAGAYNAVFAEHLNSIPDLGISSKDLGAQFQRSCMRGAPPHLDWEAVFGQIKSAGRILQLNMWAITLADAGIQPRLRGEGWTFIKNPFSALPDTDAIWTKVKLAEADVLRRHGVTVTLPRQSMF